MDNFREMMPEEYYNMVKKERNILFSNKAILDEQIANIKRFLGKINANNITYDNKELSKFITKPDSRGKMVSALKAVFGDDLFTNMSDEIKSDLTDMYKNVIGNKYGTSITFPDSFESFVDSFCKCVELSNSSSIFTVDRQKYLMFVNGIVSTLSHYYNRKIVVSEKSDNVINLYDKYINAYENKELINITDKLSDDIDNAFVDDKRTLLMLEDGSDEKKEITYNQIFKYFIGLNNYEVINLKNKKLLNKKANKIYKKLKRVNNITDDFFPSFDDEEFKPIMYELLNIINGNIDDEKSADLYAITSMQIVKYYKDSLNDKDKVKSI